MRQLDLEDRLINYAVQILEYAEKLPKNYAVNHLGMQLVRSGTSPALNYGEAQSAESKKDFVHKLRLCLKELRESLVCLKILSRKGYATDLSPPLLQETNELVSIFVSSINTATRNFK